MQRILPQGSTVYLLGGINALAPAVESAVKQAGFTVQRIAGNDRFETSVAIAKQAVTGTPGSVLLATGQNFPDALSAGAAAAAKPNAVVVLTQDAVMPAPTAAYLQGFHTDFGPDSVVNLWAVGVQARKAIDSYSHDTWYRYDEGGDTRFDTSLMLARDFFPEMEAVGFATAYNFPDSLAGGALMGERFGPLLLVDPDTGLTPAEQAFLADNRGEISEAFLFGGQVANSQVVNQEVAAGIAGPMGIASNASPAAAAAASASAARAAVPGVAGAPGAPGAAGSTEAQSGAAGASGQVGAEAARAKPTLP
jgi:hypothetical protein